MLKSPIQPQSSAPNRPDIQLLLNHTPMSNLEPSMPEQSSWPPSSVGSQPLLMGVDPLSRKPSRMSGSRYGDDPHSGVAYADLADMLSQGGSHTQYGPKIPVTVDTVSGSKRQAQKRKRDSEISRQFRNRKKNESRLQQQVNELTKQIEVLTNERDYFLHDRDFYRAILREHFGFIPMPLHPVSPTQSNNA